VEADDLPPAFVQAAEQGVRGALDSGELGYPVNAVKRDHRSELDEELSNDVPSRRPGADAVQKGMRGNMILLEPWMKIRCRCRTRTAGRSSPTSRPPRRGAEVRP